MWKEYEVTWKFQERLCGSVPMQRELVGPWLEARLGREDTEIEQEALETLDEAQERVTLGFSKDDEGLFVRGGTIKAHLKDCANQIKEVLKIKNMRSKVANRIHIVDYRVYLRKPDSGDPPLSESVAYKILQEIDDVFDQPIHVVTPRGPRNSLKTISFIWEPTLIFNVKILEDKEINIETLMKIFEYGSLHGYGGERGMGEGRYVYNVQPL